MTAKTKKIQRWLSLTLCSIALSHAPDLKAQTTVALPCVPVSADFMNFYRHKENYIPQNGMVKPLYVNKTIKVLFHVIMPTTSIGPKVNYEDNPTDRAAIRGIVDRMNGMLSNIQVPAHPKSAVCGTCYVTDSRFRVEMVKSNDLPAKDVIRFHSSTLKFEDIAPSSGSGSGTYRGDLDGFFEDKEGTLNVFLMYTASTTAPLGAKTFNPPDAPTELPVGYNSGNTFIVSENYFRTTNVDILANNLLHEIGHTLAMDHLYDYEPCDETDMDYLSDAFGTTASGTKTCLIPPGATDAFMGGNMYGNYITPLQLGRMHRNAHFLSCRKFIYNTHPEDVYHDHTGEGQLNPYIITKNENWDFDIKMYNDIVVKSGKKLSIKCRVLMPYHGNIIVEPGAELEIDGGIIGAHHDSTMWYGISVLGDKNQSQDGSIPVQGIITMKNGATIMNALHAITLYDDVFYDPSKTGGIARIQDAHFKNNRRSIVWGEYHNLTWEFRGGVWTRTRVLPNRSYVYRSTFETNERINRDPLGQVTINNVDNINILGCKFISTMPYSRSSTGSPWHNAIAASGASFNVSDYTTTSGANFPSTVKGFMHGVIVRNFGSGSNFSVSNTTLEKNQIGILTSSINASTIKNNTFLVGNPIIPGAGSIGVQINGSTGFRVYNNNFGKSTDADASKLTGVDVVQCGSDNNEIRNNTYKDLQVGNLSTGQNTNLIFNLSNEHDSKGLQFTCNTITDMRGAGMYINGYDKNVDGVRRVQGSSAEPAGNNFYLIRSGFVHIQLATHGFGVDKTLPMDKYYFSSSIPAQNPTRLDGVVNAFATSNINPCVIKETGGIDPADQNFPPSSSPEAASEMRIRLSEAYDDYSENRPLLIENALIGMHSPYAETERALLKMQYGNVAMGLSIYNSIAVNMPLTPQEHLEFELGGTIIRLVAEHYANAATTWDSLDNNQLDSLRYVRDHAKMWAKERACNWLGYAIGEYCPTILPDVDGINTQRRALDAGAQEGNFLNIIPNPGSRYFDLQYVLNETESASLMVTDITGKLLHCISLPSGRNTFRINASEWASGIYLYRMVQGGKTLYNGKLVKQ